MANSIIGKIVGACTRFAWLTILVAVVLTAISVAYTARHFSINTDISRLISPELPWRKREIQFEELFPQTSKRILVVVQAPTPELTQSAASALTERLSLKPNFFHSVHEVGGSEFFRRSAFLFLQQNDFSRVMQKLIQSEPIISMLASDSSLRGLSQALSASLGNVQRRQIALDDLSSTLDLASDAFDHVLAGRPAYFSWQALLNGQPAESDDLRRFIDVQPVLDYSALEPGEKPIAAIRQAARELKLEEDYGARVRLTGPVPIADEEIETLKEGALLNGVITIALVLGILWLALWSGRIIFAVFVALIVGLAMTAALGMMVVQALNTISIAFAVLFVGLGVDFGIQYCVRYRAERHSQKNLREALVNAGRRVGAPLTLAAGATAAGFCSFLPTSYDALSELGLIAGSGMLIAFGTSITLLPALLKLLKPRGERESLGCAFMAPVDRFLERHRIPIIVGTGFLAVGGLPMLLHLQFDFNPQNLRSPTVESMATYLELRRDPTTGAHTVQVLAPSLAQAKATAAKLGVLPEVSRVETVEHFVPEGQFERLKLIADATRLIGPALRAANPKPALSDAERVIALNTAATNLNRAVGKESGSGAAAAKRLADTLTKLARSESSVRLAAENGLVEPLRFSLGRLNEALQAKSITLESLPNDLTAAWVTPEGRARVEVFANGDPNDTGNLRTFARAVLAVQADATGEGVSILEAGDTVVRAFIEAGFWAFCSIAILLWVVLRRFGDVLLTLIPLLLAGVLTLEICVITGLQLNFANIIALPLLLGVGVAFKIYYVMAWRAGQTNLLQSSLTRAVFFSSLTTAVAFGSLWFSSHPGTSSMGKLLALSLFCTMCAAVLFQPVLMGRPRVAMPRNATSASKKQSATESAGAKPIAIAT